MFDILKQWIFRGEKNNIPELSLAVGYARLADIPKDRRDLSKKNQQAIVCCGDQMTLHSRNSLPERLRVGELCWLVPAGDIPLRVEFLLEGVPLVINLKIRFEPDHAFAAFVAQRESLSEEKLKTVILSELLSLADQKKLTVAQLVSGDSAAYAKLRVDFSLLLQPLGMRCTRIDDIRKIAVKLPEKAREEIRQAISTLKTDAEWKEIMQELEDAGAIPNKKTADDLEHLSTTFLARKQPAEVVAEKIAEIVEENAMRRQDTTSNQKPADKTENLPADNKIMNENKKMVIDYWRGCGLTEEGLATVRTQLKVFDWFNEALIDEVRQELNIPAPDSPNPSAPPSVPPVSPPPVNPLPTPPVPTFPFLTPTQNPRMKINWGANIQANMLFMPKFSITDLPFDTPPIVVFSPLPAHNFIDAPEWQRLPEIKKSRGEYYFVQELTFRGNVVMILTAHIFQNPPNQEHPLCWECQFWVVVEAEKDNNRSVTIKAGSLNAMNLGSLRANHIIIDAPDGSVVLDGTDEGEFMQALLGGGKETGTGNLESHVTTLELEPIDEENREDIPYLSCRIPQPEKRRRITLIHPDGFRTHIIPDTTFRFGRNHAPEINDVDISLLPPENADAQTAQDMRNASGLFSRLHAKITLDDNGLWLHDARSRGISRGLILDDRQFDFGECRSLDPDRQREFLISFAHLLDLKFELRNDRFFDHYPLDFLSDGENPTTGNLAGNFLMASYVNAFPSAKTTFRRAQRAGVSSVLVSHCPYNHEFSDSLQKQDAVKYLMEKLTYSFAPRQDEDWMRKWDERFRKWLAAPRDNPRRQTENHLLLLTHATLGSTMASTVRFAGRQAADWRSLLRFWNFNGTLYVECLDTPQPIRFQEIAEEKTPPEAELRCFRPIPVTRSVKIRCGQTKFEIRVEEEGE